MRKDSKQIHKAFCDYEIKKARENRRPIGASRGFITHLQPFTSNYEMKKEFEKVLQWG